MPLDLFALTFDANDPRCLADFWAEVLGRTETDDHGDGVALLPTDDTGFRLRFVPNPYAKTWVSNRAHFDLTSTSLEDQQALVERALELGGRHYDVGQLPEEKHVVLADPEDNEFDVLEPGNKFLEGCGLEGAPGQRRKPGRRLLLEQGAGLAARLGPGPGDRDPVSSRRHQDHLGRTARRAEAREEPTALRPRPDLRRRPRHRGRPARVARRSPDRHRPGRRRLGRDGRPGRQRVLRAAAAVTTGGNGYSTGSAGPSGSSPSRLSMLTGRTGSGMPGWYTPSRPVRLMARRSAVSVRVPSDSDPDR